MFSIEQNESKGLRTRHRGNAMCKLSRLENILSNAENIESDVTVKVEDHHDANVRGNQYSRVIY